MRFGSYWRLESRPTANSDRSLWEKVLWKGSSAGETERYRLKMGGFQPIVDS